MKNLLLSFCVVIALANVATAATVTIDFEGGVGDISVKEQNIATNPQIVSSTDVSGGSSGTKSGSFTIDPVDGTFGRQMAFFVKPLGQAYDFSLATWSMGYKVPSNADSRINIEQEFGIGLFEGDTLQAYYKAFWGQTPDTWYTRTGDVTSGIGGSNLGGTENWNTGFITQIDGIGFLVERNSTVTESTGNPGAHVFSLLYDDVVFDNLTAIPEPASIALFALGGCMMAFRRRK